MLKVRFGTGLLIDFVTEGGDCGMLVETDLNVTLFEVGVGQVKDEGIGMEILVFIAGSHIVLKCEHVLVHHFVITVLCSNWNAMLDDSSSQLQTIAVS